MVHHDIVKTFLIPSSLVYFYKASLLYESVPAARIDVSQTLPLPNWYPFNSPILLNRTQPPDCHSATSCSQTPVFFRFYLRASNFAHGPTFPSPVLSISMSDCNASLGQFGLATVYFPWDNQVYHMKLRKNEENKIVLRSLSPQKFRPELSDPYVDVILEPTCQSADVTVYYSFSQWLCQVNESVLRRLFAGMCTCFI
ncbi:unnamed protein product [Dibothriocephalus latus]|uniref:Uncharacterized protein n=1 Tax=Dibothriocephalus latus TaxID=60516 RepID=A0A3P7MYY1_DIBLA|nr:unnamed protein product [Dibothriocephalus latus]